MTENNDCELPPRDPVVQIMGWDENGKLWIVDVPPGAPIPSKDDIGRQLQSPKLPPRRPPSARRLLEHVNLVRLGRE